MTYPITTILDVRVPQPGREVQDYGVPVVLMPAIAALRQERNTCTDTDVDVLDAALMRVLSPYIQRY